MKKIFFTKIRANVLCNRLFLLLCCIITTTTALGEHMAKLTANVSSTGTGKVYVSKESVNIGSISEWANSSNKSYSEEKGTTINYYFHAYAKPELGYFFVNWTGDFSDISNTFSISGAQTDDNDWTKTINANFRSIVENIDKIRLYYDPVTGVVEDGELTVRVNSSTSMTVTSLDPAFTVKESEFTLKGETDEPVTIKISAQNGTTGTHSGAIQLTPINPDKEAKYLYKPDNILLDVELLPSPIVTFEPASIGGTYTYQQVGISPTPSPVSVTETKQISILKDADGVVKLVATPAAGYRIYRWKIVDADGTRYDYVSGNTKQDDDTKFTKEATVTVEFTEDKYASFFVKGNPSIKYNDLNAAIEAAASSSTKTVVVDPAKNSTLNINGGYLRAGTYTIPDGYTLLVPGDADYTTLGHAENPTDKQWASSGQTLTPKNYCKLIVESGTTINVDGVLCVYAQWNYASTTKYAMKPGNYGWIEMENNSVININNATLHALGYISNVSGTTITKYNLDEVGRVVANSNAIIYEIFVMNDWRGGSAVTGAEDLMDLLGMIGEDKFGMVKNDNHVFPMNQYYIQNVEVPLTFNPGSKEKVNTTVSISKFLPAATADFIVTNDNADPNQSGIASGLVRIGNNTKLTKYYDVDTDRLHFVVDKYDENITQTIPTFFHTLQLTLDATIMKVDVKSSDYVLPLNNNMSILVREGSEINMTYGSDLAFLPGAVLTVEKGATLNVNSNVYIYDYEERKFCKTGTAADNALGFFGPDNGDKYTIPMRAGGVALKPRAIIDGTWHINGVVNVEGALYTTASGANITSSNAGVINFNSVGSSDAKTYQAFQSSGGVSYHSIPITKAQLSNADGTFSAGNAAQAGQKYIYYPDLDGGKWSLPRTDLLTPDKTVLKITLPTEPEVTTELVCEPTKADGIRDYVVNDFNISIDNSKFNVGTARMSEGKLYIPITYTSQDKHGEYTANLTIKSSNTAAVSLNKTVQVLAIEDYKPQFSVASIVPFTSTVDIPVPHVMPIDLVEENVTTIWNHTTYGSRLGWTYTITGTNADDFSFDFGEGENKFDNAQVTFRPLTEGQDKSATLTLTATYTDGVNHQEQYFIDIPLFGNAARNKNTLVFADFPDPIYVDTEAFLLFKTGSDNAKTPITITTTPTGIVNIIGDGTDANPYKVEPLAEGVVELSVSQPASTSVAGIAAGTMITTLQVVPEEATLYPLDLCVDNQEKFSAHTVSTQLVKFDNNAIVFTSNESQPAIWQMQFQGVPQHVEFTLSGTNNWLVEQSADATTWESLPIFESGDFSGSLLPTTRYLRFTYAMGDSQGSVSGLCIYELNLSTDVEKVYLPVNADGTASSAIFTFVHTDPLTFNEIDKLNVETSTTNTGTADEPYLTTTVIVSPNANTEIDKTYTIVANDGENQKSVVVRTYRYPQLLPINLQTDEEERFYLVNHSAKSQYTTWDATNRSVVFQNPGRQTLRYVTFVFEGAPHSISFDVDGEINVDDWVISESSDGSIYIPVPTTPIVDGNTFKQELDYRSKYVYIENKSSNMSEVRLSNLTIEGKLEAFANPDELIFTKNATTSDFVLTAVNLDKVRIEVSDPVNFSFKQQGDNTELTTLSLTKDTYTGLGYNKYCDIPLVVKWKAQNMIDDAKLLVFDAQADTVMLEVRLVGTSEFITQVNAEQSGLYTGIPTGYTYHGSPYKGYDYHPVNLINTFADDGTALFDYLFIYGPTVPETGDNITPPASGGTLIGSNAVTPYYIYKKAPANEDGKYIGYQFVTIVDNANTPEKARVEGLIVSDEAGTTYINIQDSLRIYFTGFCPYATTGYTKNEEGVFLFRGNHESKLDIYLEDCHIFSRNKTEKGNNFYGNKEGSDINSDGYTRGSGGVFVFENMELREELDLEPMKVSIHTRGDNLLKSNHGCYFGVKAFGKIAMKAAQVSSPIHIHMYNKDYAKQTKTELNFDDKWPTAVNDDNAITSTVRTNGFLALKKQNNNAPSIDMGNKHTTVNFYGGRVELQNSQIVSDTYKTTLAISHRSGYFGADDSGFQLCYGIGTDSVGGTVNFHDGTVTVERMWVDPAYRQYYLMDVKLNAEGDTVREDGKIVYSDSTSCLRLPKNTYVYGGSHCSMRACQHVTSKGGAPKDGPNGSFLGQYIYTLQDGDVVNEQELAVKIQFPLNLTNPNLKDYYDSRSYTYGLKSVSPDASKKLYFWIPDGYGGVTAEQDKFMSIWKACMTEIKAGISGIAEGSVGGDTPIEPNEEVKYFLYCQIDKNIHDVISAGTGEGDDKIYTYKAPIEVPPVAQSTMGTYIRWAPSRVSDGTQYQVLSDTLYTITDRVYYITTATADIWQTFTAPFDVAKIYVVETYSEELLKTFGERSEILMEQAKHNADFAAFFGVAMAMGTDKTFQQIYNSYKTWAIAQDKDSTDRWNGNGDYTLRSMQELIPYFGNNWRDANFYLNVNNGDWTLTGEEEFDENWEMLPDTARADGILLHKGKTYSLLFPYCTGCESSLNQRIYWDYWSGKFLIFESTAAPQTINGRDFLNETKKGNIFTDTPNQNQVVVTGNSTFANLDADGKDIYVYNSYAPKLNEECFDAIVNADNTVIYPTTAFLYGNVPTNVQGEPALKISRSGKIIYDTNGDNSGNQNGTSGHIPTVGGGNDMFITAIEGGINIAVAEPQMVKVMSSTGAVLFAGYITTATDVQLPTHGIYIVSGENEVQKIMH